MDTSVLKRISLSFLIGGVIGGICQLLVFLWSALLGADSPWAGPAMLVTLAVLGLFMHVSGLTQRLCKYGEMGALMPVSGLVSTVASFFEEYLAKGGVSRGVLGGMGIFGYVVGFGIVLTLLFTFVIICAL